MNVLDNFLDEYDNHLDEGKAIDIGEHARRIDRAMNDVNCIRSGICPPPRLGRKRKHT
jgi:hypothetical protein